MIGPVRAGYLRYVDFVSDLYRYELNDFIDRNIDSPLDLLTPTRQAGGHRRLPAAGAQGRAVPERPAHPTVYSFQAMYAGLSPYDALAIYAVIAYMDSVAGVYFPEGGMHAVPCAMAAAAAAHGVDFRYSTGSPAWTWPVTARPASSRPTASASPQTPSCSTRTCRWRIAICSAASPGRCAG